MKKSLYFLMLFIMCSFMCQAQYSDIDKNTPFQRVQLRKSETPDLFPKSGMIWFSEKPNGEESGYYGVQTANGFVYDGKGNKVRTGSMKSLGNGWYEYDFNKTLYVLRTGDLPHMENVRIIWENSSSSRSNYASSSTNENKRNTAAKEGKGTEVPPLVMLTPKPNLVETGWTLTETTQKDGVTCETYSKEIEDEDVYRYLYKKGDGEFIVLSEKEESPQKVINKEIKDTYSEKESIKAFEKFDYKWTLDDGRTFLWKADVGRKQIVYANGMVYDYHPDEEQRIERYNTEYFDKQEVNGPVYLYLSQNYNVGYSITHNTYGFEHSDNITDWSGGNRDIIYTPRNIMRINNGKEGNTIRIGDQYYYAKEDKFYPILQKIGEIKKDNIIRGVYFPVSPTDTIINSKIIWNKDTVLSEKKYKYYSFEVFYKNGDRYKGVVKKPKDYSEKEEFYEIATRHRMNGVFDITKKGDATFTRNDGTVFKLKHIYGESLLKEDLRDIVGRGWSGNNYWMYLSTYQNDLVYTFNYSEGGDEDRNYMLDSDPDFKFYKLGKSSGSIIELFNYIGFFNDKDTLLFTGEATYPDGKTEKIFYGKGLAFWKQIKNEKETSYAEVLAKEKAERNKKEAEEKAEEAKNRNFYIQKWGFYPGDYIIREAIKPGRPFGALEKYFLASLIIDNGSSKCYRLFYTLNDSCTVWVSNGTVTSVRW